MAHPLVISRVRALVFGLPVRIDKRRVSATVETWDMDTPERPAAAWAVLFLPGGPAVTHIGGTRSPLQLEESVAVAAAAIDVAGLAAARRI
jgi:hypothetical protein